MNIFLFIGAAFLVISFLGKALERIRIPWIFAALFLGLALAFVPAWGLDGLERADVFVFMANLGMYFLLFLIGYELDLVALKKLGNFIVKSTFIVIFFEGFIGSLLIHYVFGYEWLISGIVALSFATVGEAMLIPILDEFKLTKTRLGQTILGIGTLDDVIEIFLIVLVTVLFPLLQHDGALSSADLVDRLAKPVLGLGALVLLGSFFLTFDKKIRKFKLHSLESSFFLLIAFLFIFLGIANIASAELGALGAIMAGVVVSNILPTERKAEIEKEIKALSYGFFAPIFFLWVGMETDVHYLLTAPGMIVLVIAVTYLAKILASFLVGYRELGPRKSLFMGLALGVRFSTSIVIIKFMYENNIIHAELYSILIGSTIAFKFIIPFLLSTLVKRWNLAAVKGRF